MEWSADEFIRTKRDGGAHSATDLKAFVDGFLGGRIPDYQVSAWLMAVFFRGLEPQELVDWTTTMWKSGRSLSRQSGQGFWVDKHSTGGVGDKSSLILVPLVTCVAERLFGSLAVRIPMISGRGLGFTGGTLDKLDSVPGFRSRLDLDTALSLLNSQGFFMSGQSEDLAPADRRTYALRDVTATVESIPLIVSSILSKKLSESLDGLVMDIKVGKGANFQSINDAKILASEIARVGGMLGLKITTVLSSMDEPTGYCVGHALEMEECAEYLSPGKNRHAGLDEVVRKLALEMLMLVAAGRVSCSELEAEIDLELSSNHALNRFISMLETQGGDWKAFQSRPLQSHHAVTLRSDRPGRLLSVNARTVALVLRELGGARRTQEQAIDFEVGVRLVKAGGMHVNQGEVLAEMVVPNTMAEEQIERVLSRLKTAFEWSNESLAERVSGAWVLDVHRY